MVWFQCEDCGENLKKPKLPNHFRMCSATRLSCIDCGQVFGKQAVQGHNQCISEAEKYGPKGEGKAASGTPAKPSGEKKNADVDVHVGLSQRPPWFCSLCNTKATSQQALLIHADGKKHRAKARAVHAANQPKPTEETDATAAASADEASRNKVSEKKDAEGAESPPKIAPGRCTPASEIENISGKKRKISTFDDDRSAKKSGVDAQTESGNGKVQVHKEADEPSKKVRRTKHEEQENGGHESGPASDKIKWKKLIMSTLKSSPDGALKMKKLQKLVRKSLLEAGIPIDVDDFSSTLVEKVTSSSRFTIDGKYVRLASKE